MSLMLKVTLVAVGRARGGPEVALVEDYVRRLRWPFTLVEVQARKATLQGEALKAEEAVAIRAKLPQGAALVALDERGRLLDSRSFAAALGGFAESGRREVALVIGGADGLDASLRDQADLVLALGRLTFPHMLVRALIAEQIYRAQTILDGHPYHRD